MSSPTTAIIACENVQMKLDELYGESVLYPITRGLFDILNSPLNRNGLQMVVSPGGGKKRVATLTYTPRYDLGSVTQGAYDCTATEKRGMLSTNYQLPANPYKVEQLIASADLSEICESDESYVANTIARMIDVVRRRLNTVSYAAMAASWGAFADNGSSLAKNIVTQLADGALTTQGIRDIKYYFENMEYTGALFVLSANKDLYDLALAGKMVNLYSSTETDLTKTFTATDMLNFHDPYASALGNGATSGNPVVGAFMPGALQAIYFNEFVSEVRRVDTDIYKTGVIYDPISGVPFDYIARFDCGNWHLTVGLNYDVVALPSDMFDPDDRLDGVRYVNRFDIVNP